MKLQHLTVIFVLIIVPIVLVLSTYINNQITTISNQNQYDANLIDSTYDAVKAFQLNTANNNYSTVGNSKIRDIEASVSTYFASLATSLSSSGYNKEDLQDYTPALLYTLYDGYYIYSSYYDTELNGYTYGLKPFIYYSCRYKNGTNYDFVVNYTLDNTITIIGTVDGEYVTETGHLINTKSAITPTTEVFYENLIILNENDNKPQSYNYIVYNSQKYYKENGINNSTSNNQRYFLYSSTWSKDYVNDITTINYLNSKLNSSFELESSSAQEYYSEAQKFTEWVNAKLSRITQENAVDQDGNSIQGQFSTNTGTDAIFVTSESNDPMVSGSIFNENRLSVIKYSIETNLVAAIANYNRYTTKGYEFAMPKLSEIDWDKIENNVCMVSFLQGLPIGSKIYNNYCVVSNNTNKETVGNNSIYIIAKTDTNEVEYHYPGCKTLIDNLDKYEIIGAFASSDFERKTVSLTGDDSNAVGQLGGTESGKYAYYYPQSYSSCYNCIVTVSDAYSTDDIISDNVRNSDNKKINIDAVRTVYLRALARTRYDLYLTNGYFKNIK